MRSSKRACSAASSAERTGFGRVVAVLAHGVHRLRVHACRSRYQLPMFLARNFSTRVSRSRSRWRELQPAVAFAGVDDVFGLVARRAHRVADRDCRARAARAGRRCRTPCSIGTWISAARSTGAAALSIAASLTGSPISIGAASTRAISRPMSFMPALLEQQARIGDGDPGDTASVQVGMADRRPSASHSRRSWRRRCRRACRSTRPCRRPSATASATSSCIDVPQFFQPAWNSVEAVAGAAAELGLDDDIAARCEELGLGIPAPSHAAQPGSTVDQHAPPAAGPWRLAGGVVTQTGSSRPSRALMRCKSSSRPCGAGRWRGARLPIVDQVCVFGRIDRRSTRDRDRRTSRRASRLRRRSSRQIVRLTRPGKRASASCCSFLRSGSNQTVVSASVTTRTPEQAVLPVRRTPARRRGRSRASRRAPAARACRWRSRSASMTSVPRARRRHVETARPNRRARGDHVALELRESRRSNASRRCRAVAPEHLVDRRRVRARDDARFAASRRTPSRSANGGLARDGDRRRGRW